MKKINKIAECQLTWTNKKKSMYYIADPDSASRLMRDHYPRDINVRERLYIMALSRKNEVMGVSEISAGGMNWTAVDLKLMFSVLLKAAAPSFIVFHNHPSGNLSPSHQDLELTKKVQDASKLLDITFIDHIIITESGYTSLREETNLIQ